MPDAHSLRTAHGHAPRRTDVAPGLEVSLRYILQDLFVQRQIRDQPLQLAVLFLQFLHPLCLVHLQTAVFLPPAVERLDGDLGFFAGLGGGFSVCDADFNLPQHRHDLLWLVPLDRHVPLFLQVDSLSFHLVQILPVRSPPQQDYAWATIERKHHGFRLLTKSAERKVVWTYWNITSVAADDLKASSEVQRGARVPQSEYVEDREHYLKNNPDKADWKQRADKACLSSDVYFDEDDGAKMKKCSDRPWKPQQPEQAKEEAVKTPSSSKPQPSAASRPDGDIVAALHSEKQDTLPPVTKTAYMIKREGKYFIEDRVDGLLPNDVVLFSDSTCVVDPTVHVPDWDYVSVCRGQVWEGWLTRRPAG